jgi:ATP-dependent 26S proteasome regulatory subunit
VTSWLLEKQTKIILTTRHFSLVNQRLLQLCAFDKVIEMKAPSQQQRYHFIKQEIASADLCSKEVTLQRMSHQTEYFLAKDLFY